MKKILLSTFLVFPIYMANSYYSASFNSNFIDTIYCPAGDKYNCYVSGGVTVRKGDGDTIIIING